MKKVLALVLALVLTLPLSACSQKNISQSSDSSSSQKQNASVKTQYLSLGTGGVTGTYYPMGGAIADLISQNIAGYECTAESTGGSGENVQLVANGQVEIAFCDASTAYQAQTGTGAFEGDQKDNLVAITSLYNEAVQVVTLDPDIKTIGDLKGKRVAVGSAGSGTEIMARTLFELYNMTYDDVKVDYLGFGDASAGLKDNTLDAGIIWAGIPTSGILELGAQHEIYMLNFSDDIIAKLQESHPFCVKTKITRDIYNSLVQEINTISIPCMLVCNRDLDEELVYNTLVTMFDNLDVIASSHARGADVSLQKALDGMEKVEMHPGAIKFFTEKGLL